MKPNIILCDKHTLLVQVYGCNVVRINGLLTGHHGSHYGYHLALVTRATVITMVNSLLMYPLSVHSMRTLFLV